MADNHPLRVLFVGYGQNGTTFLNRLAQGLAGSGMQITLATFSKHRPTWLEQFGIQRLWTPPWTGNPFLRLFKLVWLCLTRFSLKRARWIIQQMKIAKSWLHALQRMNRYLPFIKGQWDLIYFPWNSTAIGYQGLFELGIPVVVSCRGSQINIRPHLPGQEGYVQALSTSLQQATAVHCVSFDIQQSVIGLGVSPDRCRIIRPAVEPDFFSPPAHPPDNQRLTLISTGSLIWSKSYETMITALKHLVDTGIDAELHIIGEGPELQHILFTIHDLGLQERVTLHGRLAPSAVRDHLRAADVFVLSSLSEGISNAALEGMSCGLPVVTTDCGGMREAITDGVEGFIVPLRDPQAMAAALLKLADDSLLRSRIGATGRNRVIADFNLDDQINAFHALFYSVTKSEGLVMGQSSR
jgi:colanic acid/amylovoran biosynthesis glycosyltransferase